MTREGAIKWKKEILAFIEGETIQMRYGSCPWEDVPKPVFDEDCEYRIKREPREFLLITPKSSPLASMIKVRFLTPTNEAHLREEFHDQETEIIKVREVID